MWKLLQEFFQQLFDEPPQRPMTRTESANKPAPPPAALPTAAQTESIRKAVSALRLISRSYRLNLYVARPGAWEDFAHDVAVMLANNDLDSIRLRVFRQGGAVIYQHAIRFDQPSRGRETNPAAGLELPVISPELIGGSDLIVSHLGKDNTSYKTLLKLPWAAATPRQLAQGATVPTKHGRSTGHDARFTVTNEARVRLVVHRVGAKGYAFAEDPNGQSVFVYAPAAKVQVGQTLSAILVQTPKGLQARAIEFA
jgi:hypothetical protein